MKSFQHICDCHGARSGLCFGVHVAGWIALALFLLSVSNAVGQVVPAAEAGGFGVFAGATASAATLQYGQRKMFGFSAFVDVDTRSHLGWEGEARWLVFRQTDQVSATTWLAGPRYRVRLGSRFQVYAKALVGIGDFNFPYHYAHGRYLVVGTGAGVDFSVSGRVRLRLAECEFQNWPQFTFGSMSSMGISSGVRIRIF